MAVRPVLRMGDPRLLEPSRRVEQFDTRELHALIADLNDTMEALNGAGLAAPQIGVGLQVVIFGVEANPRYPEVEPVPYTVLINPTLTPLIRECDSQDTILVPINPAERPGTPISARDISAAICW